MVYIIGPVSGRTTLNDTAGDDTIYARGPDNIVDSLYGNDTITAGHGSQINAGVAGDGIARNVTIKLFDTGNTVDGGDGDFSIVAAQGDSTILLGYGNSNVTLDGGGDDVTVGLGANVIAAYGGGSSITVTNAYLLSPSNPSAGGYASPGDHITLSGLGNSVTNATISSSLADPIIPVPMFITGGSGDGSFSLDGGGSLVTGGLNNSVSVGDGSYFINPGSGHDTVGLGGYFDDSVNIQLNGTDNLVEGIAGSTHIYGGAGHNTVDFNNDSASFVTSDQNIRLGGSDNTITAALGSFSGTIDPGGSNATITLQGLDFADMTFRGTGDRLTLNSDVSGGTVHDMSSGLFIDVTGVPSLTIDNFGYDRGAVVKIDFGGMTDSFGGTPFASAQAVYDHVQAGAGGAVLNLDNGGQIIFAGLAVSALSAKNFAV